MAWFLGVYHCPPMLKLVMVALIVTMLVIVAQEIGDRRGFSPLSKIAQAFDARPATILAAVPTMPAPPATPPVTPINETVSA